MLDTAKIDSNSGTADIKVSDESKAGVSSPQMDGVPVTIDYYYRDDAESDYTKATTETVTKYSIAGATITSQYAFNTFGEDRTDYTLDKVTLADHDITADTLEDDATYTIVPTTGLTIGVYYTAEDTTPPTPTTVTVTYKNDVTTDTPVTKTGVAKGNYTLLDRNATEFSGWTKYDTTKYEFKGWKVEGTTDAEVLTSLTYNLTADTTFVAVYGAIVLPPTGGTKIYYEQPEGVAGAKVTDSTTSTSYTLLYRTNEVFKDWDTPEGYEFDCWVLEDEEYAGGDAYTVKESVTFVAKYKIKEQTPTTGFTVKYEFKYALGAYNYKTYTWPDTIASGSKHKLQSLDEIGTKGSIDDIDDTGFVGWYDKDDSTKHIYNAGDKVTITKDTTFVAVYSDDVVTVTYKQPDGWSGVAGDPVEIKVFKSSEYTLLGWDDVAALAADKNLTNWTKDGRYFVGWDDNGKIWDEDGTFSTGFASDRTFEAQYLQVNIVYQQPEPESDYPGDNVFNEKCIVTENADGSVAVTLANYNAIVTESKELADKDDTLVAWSKPSNRNFSGWSVTETSDRDPIEPEGSAEEKDLNIKDAQKVKKDLGVTPSAGSALYLGGADYPISAEKLDKIRENDGILWLEAVANYEKSGGSHVIYYTLDFDSNGGSSIDSITAAGGTVIDVDKYIPTKKGYDFKGWYYDEKLKNPVGSSLGLTSSMTIYAKWSEKETNEDGTPSDLNSKDHIKYVVGYPDGYVRPNNFVTRAETASMLYRLLTDERRAEVQTFTNNFSDVAADAWYVEPASSMYKGGYIAGYEDGTFGGDRNITRAEFVSMLVRFIGTDEGVMNFTDVPKSHWAYENIAIATAQGWISGYSDGTFKPDQAITRAEAMSIINRVLNRGVNASSNISGFKAWPDNYSNAWYYYDVIEATNSHDYTGERPSENWSNVK